LGHEFAKRECVLHKKLNHPNIIQVYDYAETNERYIIWMEYAGSCSEYFINRIINQRKAIRNEKKLKLWAR